MFFNTYFFIFLCNVFLFFVLQEECSRPMKELAHMINNRPQDPQIKNDVHLSMFILAEVHVNMPEARRSHAGNPPLMANFYFIIGITVLLLSLTHSLSQPIGSLSLFTSTALSFSITTYSSKKHPSYSLDLSIKNRLNSSSSSSSVPDSTYLSSNTWLQSEMGNSPKSQKIIRIN